jgi:asparagine synthase (glutamine-hydrolysing)
MCGISGVLHFGDKTTNEKVVVKMRDTLVHRGPDDSGTYVSPDGKVGFGTRRLAIIDLSPAGHMPMSDTEGKVWITYNGEIYNFKKAREELEKKGYRFRSKGDTEVIIASYLAYGEDCVKHLNGMFAFAIWDERRGTLFAARDHLGIKPFYYAARNGTFYFGSEIKAILAHPDFKKELNEEGVSHYLTFSCLPSPHTLFSGVKKLSPAHYLLVDSKGNVREKEYWNPARAAAAPKNEGEYIEEVRSLLRESIRSQMVSDVPFGCLLSGGIDSSTNAALMSEALGHPVETFSVGTEGYEKYNEFGYSRLMGKHLGSKVHETIVAEHQMEEFLPRFPYFADDLNGDQVCFPLYYLAKLVKESGVTVVQIGEGSDEIFAGYNTYLLAYRLHKNLWRFLEKLPTFATRSAFYASQLLVHPRFDFHKEYLRRLTALEEPFWGNAIAFGDYQKEKLMTEGFRKRIAMRSYSVIKDYYDEIREIDNSADFVKRLTYLELKHRLPELLLMRADKMTMAHSVEGRVPFLDRRLVELAINIPTAIKLKGGQTKHVLKKAVEGIIPHELIYRKKQGFATAMSEWLKPNHAVSRLLLGTIFNSKLKERKLLNYEFVKTLIDAHQKRNVEHNFRLWNLVTLSAWYDCWFG